MAREKKSEKGSSQMVLVEMTLQMGMCLRYLGLQKESLQVNLFGSLYISNFLTWNMELSSARATQYLRNKKLITFLKDRNYGWSSILFQTKRERF